METNGENDKGKVTLPEKNLKTMLKMIDSGDFKNAEGLMTQSAKNFRFPMGSEKWADEIADLIDKGWRVEDSEIFGFTARVKVAVKYQKPNYTFDQNGSHVKFLDKEKIWVFLLEKENGKWLFDRLPEYY